MRRSLFFPLVLGGIMCLGGAARAQQPDARMDKILKPDTSRGFNLEREKSFGSSAFESKPRATVDIKSYAGPQKFNSKEYLTGAFHNEKAFWMGDFKYSVGEANTKPRFVLPDKTFGTKSSPVKAVSGTEKRYESASVPTRDFRGREREKLKNSLTPEQAAENSYFGTNPELKSIDDVRALLNKSK